MKARKQKGTPVARALTFTGWRKQAGLGYTCAKKIWANPTFPKNEGRVYWSHWMKWAERMIPQKASPSLEHLPMGPGLELGGGHTAGGSIPTSDLLGALPPRGERLRVLAGSL